MKRKEIKELLGPFIEPYRVTSGKSFKLSDVEPGDTCGLDTEQKAQSKDLLRRGTELLAELQDKLYADNQRALLLVFQAMDAAGKDGTIKHVMSGVNPQGCQVFSFKQPSAEELDHDFMWRYARCVPERGRIGIFNRSYYEEVLVVRVHSAILEKQNIPPELVTKNIWSERLDYIRSFEEYLERNGITVLKFFLHLSRGEQKKRFLARLDRPEKNWKFSPSDIEERKYWKDYAKAYEEAIRGTATKENPWFVVPADNKWFTRLVVAAAIVDKLESFDLKYPTVSKAQLESLKQAKEQLLDEK